MSFASLGLSEKICQTIAHQNYTEPTPVQTKIIPLILKGCDVFGIAQTGTGKTASYCLPLLDLLAQSRLRARLPRVLILAPTRELALQINESIASYGQNFQIKTAVVIGGESSIEQERALNKGADIIIATPGRLLDTLNRGKVMLSGIEILVIDEVDRMMDMGFIPEIEKIFTYVVKKHQSLLFSATVSDSIRKLIGKFLNNPIEIFITPSSQTAETIEQCQILVPKKQKQQALQHLIAQENVQTAIIFCNRKRDVSSLYTFLKRQGSSVGMIHGDLTQGERTETLAAFKQGMLKFLVASDIAARGLDIDDLDFVFNFDTPINAEEYIHRIGRTGRAGRHGKAFTLVCEEDRHLIAPIEKLIAKSIPLLTLGDEFEKLEKKTASKTRSRRRKGPNAQATSSVSSMPPLTATDSTDNAEDVAQSAIHRHTTTKVPQPKTPRHATTSSATSPTTDDPSSLAATDFNHPQTTKETSHMNRRHNTLNRRQTGALDKKPIIGFGDQVPAFFNLFWSETATSSHPS